MSTTATRATGKAKCEHRSCRRFLPKRGSTGHRKAYCDHTCRRAERTLRDGKTYVRKGYPKINPKNRKHAPGGSWADLTLIEYRGKAKGGMQALFACSCGNEKVLSISNVVQGRTTTCADRAKHVHPSDRGMNVGYVGAHYRVTRAKGPAKALPCLICEQITEGNQHAFLHSDPNQKVDTLGREKGKPYSTDSEHYTVLCKSHHYWIDRAHKSTTPKGTTSLFHVALQAMVAV